MANSADVNAGDDILASQYNNLRKDVIDPTLGHNHEGVEGKILLAGALATNSVETLKIKDGNVTAPKLATNSVETLKIEDLNVTAAKLATDSVETLKIKNANVTLAKLKLSTGSYSQNIPATSYGTIFETNKYGHQIETKQAAGGNIRLLAVTVNTEASWTAFQHQFKNDGASAHYAYAQWAYHSASKQAIWGVWDKEAKKLTCVLVEEDDGIQKLFPELKENQKLVKIKNPERFLDSGDKEKIKEKTMAGYILEHTDIKESDIEEVRKQK